MKFEIDGVTYYCYWQEAGWAYAVVIVRKKINCSFLGFKFSYKKKCGEWGESKTLIEAERMEAVKCKNWFLSAIHQYIKYEKSWLKFEKNVGEA